MQQNYPHRKARQAQASEATQTTPPDYDGGGGGGMMPSQKSSVAAREGGDTSSVSSEIRNVKYYINEVRGM